MSARARLALPALAILLAAPGALISSEYQLDIACQALYMASLTGTWSLLAGIGGQFSFAHIALPGIAGYAGTIWGREFAGGGPIGSLGAAIAIGALAAWLAGTVLGVILLRLRGAYLALFTLAFAEIARLVVIAEKDVTGGWLSLATQQIPGGSRAHYFAMLGTLAVVFAAIYTIANSRIGLFLRAMREDAEAAAAAGVDTTRLKVLLFSAASLLVGLTGSVYDHTTPRLTPEIFDLLGMGFVVVYAVIGGLESPVAGALAAIGLVILPEALRVIAIGPIRIEPGVWRYASFGALLILTLRLAPNGFLAPLIRRIAGDASRSLAAIAACGGDAEAPVRAPGATRPGALRIENLEMSFNGVDALRGVSFAIDRPQICGLIGPNGAGKTTLVNLISGYHRATGGAVILGEERIDGLRPDQIVARGVGRTFQITRSFRRLTCLENLLVPQLARHPSPPLATATEQARRVLQRLGLAQHGEEPAGALSGGQQKLLELGRLLTLDTGILLLDEPFAGVHPELRKSIGSLIRRLQHAGRAVLLIEHDLASVFDLCDRVIVLDRGVVVADGPAHAIRNDPRVIAAYLGSSPVQH